MHISKRYAIFQYYCVQLYMVSAGIFAHKSMRFDIEISAQQLFHNVIIVQWVHHPKMIDHGVFVTNLQIYRKTNDWSEGLKVSLSILKQTFCC